MAFGRAWEPELSGTWRFALASIFALVGWALGFTAADLGFAIPFFVIWTLSAAYVVYSVEHGDPLNKWLNK